MLADRGARLLTMIRNDEDTTPPISHERIVLIEPYILKTTQSRWRDFTTRNPSLEPAIASSLSVSNFAYLQSLYQPDTPTELRQLLNQQFLEHTIAIGTDGGIFSVCRVK
jgi:hypothetical protein